MKGTCARGNRHSLIVYKEEASTIGSLNTKEQNNVHNVNSVCKFDDEPKQASEMKGIPANITEQGNVKIVVQS